MRVRNMPPQSTCTPSLRSIVPKRASTPTSVADPAQTQRNTQPQFEGSGGHYVLLGEFKVALIRSLDEQSEAAWGIPIRVEQMCRRFAIVASFADGDSG